MSLGIVAGIEPSSLGFKSVLIEPHLGPLHTLTASYPHPLGPIDVHYTRSNGKLHATITLPRGLHGSFRYNGHTYPIPNGTLDLTLPNSSRTP